MMRQSYLKSILLIKLIPGIERYEAGLCLLSHGFFVEFEVCIIYSIT